MKKPYTKTSLSVIFFALLFGCQPNASSSENNQDQIQAIAKELCKCMQPMLDHFKEIEAVQLAASEEDIQQMIDEFEVIADEADACASRLEKKYGEPYDEDKAIANLQKECPEIASLLQQME